jgi:hypothetical protein
MVAKPKVPFWLALVPPAWFLSQFPAIYFLSFGQPEGSGKAAIVVWTTFWLAEAVVSAWFMFWFMKRELQKNGMPIRARRD